MKRAQALAENKRIEKDRQEWEDSRNDTIIALRAEVERLKAALEREVMRPAIDRQLCTLCRREVTGAMAVTLFKHAPGCVLDASSPASRLYTEEQVLAYGARVVDAHESREQWAPVDLKALLEAKS